MSGCREGWAGKAGCLPWIRPACRLCFFAAFRLLATDAEQVSGDANAFDVTENGNTLPSAQAQAPVPRGRHPGARPPAHQLCAACGRWRGARWVVGHLAGLMGLENSGGPPLLNRTRN